MLKWKNFLITKQKYIKRGREKHTIMKYIYRKRRVKYDHCEKEIEIKQSSKGAAHFQQRMKNKTQNHHTVQKKTEKTYK